LFIKNENEDINDYILRLGLIREENDLSWSDICSFIKDQYDVDLNSNSVRKRYKRKLNSTHFIDRSDVDQKIVDKQDLFRLKAEKNQLDNYYTTLSREETLKQIGLESARIIAENYPFKETKSITEPDFKSEFSGILLIGDWHYGINIKNPLNIYNTDVCKERVLTNLLYDLIFYIDEFNIQTLYVVNLSDMIAGNIHLPLRLRSQVDVITQTIEVSELIAKFLEELSDFVNIEYYSTFDNHSRIDPNKKDSIQLESLVRITNWFLKERLSKNSKIKIHDNNEYSTDIVSFKVNGFNVVAVHGDKDNPKQAIDRLTTFTGKHIDLVCTAHYHHFSCEEQNRTMLVSNGALMGTDDYAIDLRLDSKPSQTLIVSDHYDVCKHICKLNLDKDIYN